MAGEIYLVGEGGRLVGMSEQEYESEDVLQRLLSDYPGLLAGDQIDSESPRKWILVTREASIPIDDSLAGYLSADHLFLDQDGVPTIVEVKRSSDTRLRREVIGQMLDYAANFVAFRSAEWIRAQLESAASSDDEDAETRLQSFLGDEMSFERFWDQVKGNLERGRVRLLFVADEIPTELRRVVEFLNSQMDPAEVLAVEVKRFAGGSQTAYVPRVLGQTAKTEAKVRGARHWDEKTFFEELKSKRSSKEYEAARALWDWMVRQDFRRAWGSGRIVGSLYCMIGPLGDADYTFIMLTSGRIQIPFMEMLKRPALRDDEKRRELLAKLNQIPNMSLPDDAIHRWPGFPLAVLIDESARKQFLDVFDWYGEEVRAASL